MAYQNWKSRTMGQCARCKQQLLVSPDNNLCIVCENQVLWEEMEAIKNELEDKSDRLVREFNQKVETMRAELDARFVCVEASQKHILEKAQAQISGGGNEE